jgi:hypothetical protein
MMDTVQNATTVAIKPCHVCARGLLGYDRFCRWCGVRQPEAAASSAPGATCQPALLDGEERGRTERLCQRVSGPLIDAMVEGMAFGASVGVGGSFMRAAIVTLVSLPVWLMIILLSPLDAYAAARSLVKQV